MDLDSKAKKIKLILTDVDGVLTDGSIIFDANGVELKSWNVKDGLSSAILKRLGNIKVGWITGRSSKSVENRAKSLGVDYLFQGKLDKKSILDKIIAQENINKDEILYIGDDLLDIPILEEVGISVCPSDAVEEVRDIVDVVAHQKGGRGVFRFAVKLVLKAQNKWDDVIKLFQKI